jgi:hypothetical protein
MTWYVPKDAFHFVVNVSDPHSPSLQEAYKKVRDILHLNTEHSGVGIEISDTWFNPDGDQIEHSLVRTVKEFEESEFEAMIVRCHIPGCQHRFALDGRPICTFSPEEQETIVAKALASMQALAPEELKDGSD